MDEFPVSCVPPVVTFSGWKQAVKGGLERNLLVKNNCDEAKRALFSQPQTPFFRIAPPTGSTPVNAGLNAFSYRLPPNSVTKMLVQLDVPEDQHGDFQNLCDVVLLRAAKHTMMVKLEARHNPGAGGVEGRWWPEQELLDQVESLFASMVESHDRFVDIEASANEPDSSEEEEAGDVDAPRSGDHPKSVSSFGEWSAPFSRRACDGSPKAAGREGRTVRFAEPTSPEPSSSTKHLGIFDDSPMSSPGTPNLNDASEHKEVTISAPAKPLVFEIDGEYFDSCGRLVDEHGAPIQEASSRQPPPSSSLPSSKAPCQSEDALRAAALSAAMSELGLAALPEANIDRQGYACPDKEYNERLEREFAVRLQQMRDEEHAQESRRGFQQSTKAHTAKVKLTSVTLPKARTSTGNSVGKTASRASLGKSANVPCKAGNLEKQFKDNWDALG